MNDVFSISSGPMRIFPWKASMKLKSAQLAVESTNRSIRDRGQGSFRQNLFNHVKSLHILHFPGDCFTNTTLEIQSQNWSSRIWPASSRRSTSALIMSFNAWVLSLFFCHTGQDLRSTCSWWTMTLGSTPTRS